MKKIDSKLFKEMLIGGATNISARVQEINDLNVFPVPDGDTGTNMYVTIQSGKDAIEDMNGNHTIEEIAAAFSRSSLLGASGNSGVILSQFLKGISVGVQGKEELAAEDFVKIFTEAKKLAYSSVKNPVEGTILTLTKSLAEHAKKHIKINKKKKLTLKLFFSELTEVIKETVEDTPNLLPALKEANVVDSGAFGLGLFIDGMIKVYRGEEVQTNTTKTEIQVHSTIGDHSEPGYCTEFIIMLEKNKIKSFKKEKLEKDLEKVGGSTVIVHDEDIIKVHTHSLTPGKVLTLGQKYGEFSKIKIDNMQQQVLQNKKVAQKVKVAIIAVSNGVGVSEKFKQLGTHSIIFGGQTMNPRTNDFIQSIKNIEADEYIILPNNKNIIMSAKQAKKELKDKKITVIETKTVWEGLNCLMHFDHEGAAKDVKKEFKNVIKNSLTVEITKAIKDTIYKGKEIKKNEFMAISNGKILEANKSILNIFEFVSNFLKKENSEYAMIIKGKDAINTKKLVNTLEKEDIEIDQLNGQQPVYHFIIGGEK